MTSRLIDVRGPTAQEAEDGADIVFVRVDDGISSFIKASYSDDGAQQWGAMTRILSDNVDVVEAWAKGMAEVRALIREEDDEESDEEIATDAGYSVVFSETSTSGFPFTVLNPEGEDLAYCASEDDAWKTARIYAEGGEPDGPGAD